MQQLTDYAKYWFNFWKKQGYSESRARREATKMSRLASVGYFETKNRQLNYR